MVHFEDRLPKGPGKYSQHLIAKKRPAPGPLSARDATASLTRTQDVSRCSLPSNQDTLVPAISPAGNVLSWLFRIPTAQLQSRMPRQFIKPNGRKAVKPVKAVFSAPWRHTQTPVSHGRNRATPRFRDGGIGIPWSTDFGWPLKMSALSGQRSFGNSTWWQKRVVIQRSWRFKLLGTG